MKQIKTHDICPDENELAMFVEGKLRGSRLAAVKRHLEECSVCNEVVRVYMEFAAMEAVKMKDDEVAMRRAARTGNNLCVLYAERYILQSFGMAVKMDDLIGLAWSDGWLNREGVQFRCIGKVLEHYGIEVIRKSGSTIPDIRKELARNHFVIVGVDAGELFARTKIRKIKEKVEDWFENRPDHALIVTSVCQDSPKHGEISLLNFEKARPKEYTVPLNKFMEAWEDSGNYMVIIKKLN